MTEFHESQPLVSIVTPSYNQGHFIEETIQSVLSQDYPNIEYIVMDGGSTDGTARILGKYTGKLRWVSEPDKGQTDAIQKGFRLAKGEILAWLNSDDLYLPGAVSRIVEYLTSHPETHWVYGRTLYGDEKGRVIGEYPTVSFCEKRLAETNMIGQPSAFFTREAYEVVGGLDERLHYAMDFDLWIRLGRRCPGTYLPEALALFRLHGESKTMSPTSALKRHEECLRTVLTHYHTAPLNRVFGYAYYRVLSRIPGRIGRVTGLVWLGALGLSIVVYLRLNNGIRKEDLALLTFTNIRKMFVGWEPKVHE